MGPKIHLSISIDFSIDLSQDLSVDRSMNLSADLSVELSIDIAVDLSARWRWLSTPPKQAKRNKRLRGIGSGVDPGIGS